MSDRLDEIGWGDTSERGRWHEVVGDLLCLGSGVTMASLWAASCLACFFLPGGRADEPVDDALGYGTFTQAR
jgi:hypothetical protein